MQNLFLQSKYILFCRYFFKYGTEISTHKEIAIWARKELACGLVLGEHRFPHENYSNYKYL